MAQRGRKHTEATHIPQQRSTSALHVLTNMNLTYDNFCNTGKKVDGDVEL